MGGNQENQEKVGQGETKIEEKIKENAIVNEWLKERGESKQIYQEKKRLIY